MPVCHLRSAATNGIVSINRATRCRYCSDRLRSSGMVMRYLVSSLPPPLTSMRFPAPSLRFPTRRRCHSDGLVTGQIVTSNGQVIISSAWGGVRLPLLRDLNQTAPQRMRDVVDVKLRGKKAPSSRRSRESSTSGRRANSRRELTAVKTASYRGVQSRRRLLQIRECIVRKAQAISPVGDVVARFDLARIEDFGKSLGRGTDLICEISSSIRALNSASGCMASMLSAIINCQARLRRSAWYGPAIWTPKPLPVSTPESTCIITAIAYTARISRVQSILSSHVPQQI